MTHRVKKDPNAELDYGFDWSRWLEGNDIVAQSTWEIVDDDATLTTRDGDIIESGTKTIIWLEDGTEATRYQVTNRIVTQGGRTEDQTLLVIVKSK
jgi:hypothetical protein